MTGEVEQWRAVPGYPGYEASSLGRIRSYRRVGTNRTLSETPRILVPAVNRCGYLRLTVCREDKYRCRFVHTLVLEAFVGPCPAGMEACHSPDPTPSNCALSNLRWATKSDNARDKRTHGTATVGSRNAFAKLSEGDAVVISMLAALPRADKPRRADIAKTFGISDSIVSLIANGKAWAHATGKPAVNLRAPRGEANWHSRFSEAYVREARRLRKTPAQVARETGVANSGASKMLTGKTWKHV